MLADLAMAVGLIAVAVYVIVTVPSVSHGMLGFPESAAPLGIYQSAAVATDAGMCSQIGADLLRKGGSAVDAAIGAAICTGVVKMHNSGIGGGFFMTIWQTTTQTAQVLDARETAPHYASEEMFESDDTIISSTLGPYSIAVPGEIAGFWAAHQRFGKLNWKSLFEPSIKLCLDGFQVGSIVAAALRKRFPDIENAKNQQPFKVSKRFLTNPETGKIYQTGETLRCPVLAETLTRISEFGAADFYNGSLADDILADLREVGSPFIRSDFSSYTPVWRKPVETLLQNRYRLVSTPPPGSGAILTFIMNILAGYNFNEKSGQDMLTYHRFLESLKFGYAKRTHLGDTDFVSELEPLLGNLTLPNYAEYVRSLINDTQTQPLSYYDPEVKEAPRDHGTCHISVLDSEGNAVSMTTTINTLFGSGVIGRRTGILFNNEMDDFSSPHKVNFFGIPPSPNNFIRPGKRPQSSTCPAVLLTQDPSDPTGKKSIPFLVIGASGGSCITSAVAYTTMRVLWFNENLKQATDAFRLHHQLIPDVVLYEKHTPDVLLDLLKIKGHSNHTPRTPFADVQSIERLRNGTIFAHSDFRKEIGFPDGY